MFNPVISEIYVEESEQPPMLVDLEKTGDLFLNRKFTRQFRLRREVYQRIKDAQRHLPRGYRFMIYEAFRPRRRQFELWTQVMAQVRAEQNGKSEHSYTTLAEKFVANPHGIGSGHQAGAAVDITLCTAEGREIFMGTEIQQFNAKTRTACAKLSADIIGLRHLLCDALEVQGVMNDPSIWWHFSYGDRLWAEVTGRSHAFYAPID